MNRTNTSLKPRTDPVPAGAERYTATSTHSIDELIATLRPGDLVQINDRRAQRVTKVVPQGVIIQGDWKGAAKYELHTDGTLYPMTLSRRYRCEQYSVDTMRVDRRTALTAWRDA